LIKEFGC
jgi:RNA polymerase sigma-70 factor (ECF subfamily)